MLAKFGVEGAFRTVLFTLMTGGCWECDGMAKFMWIRSYLSG